MRLITTLRFTHAIVSGLSKLRASGSRTLSRSTQRLPTELVSGRAVSRQSRRHLGHCIALVTGLLIVSSSLDRASVFAQPPEPAAVAPQATDAAQTPASADDDSYFNNHLSPLFMKRCQQCHGGAKQEGGVDLRTPQSIYRGGEQGSLLSENVDESLLWRVIQPDAEQRMPPEGEPLSEDERLAIRHWLESSSDRDWSQWAGSDDTAFVDPYARSAESLPASGLDPTAVIDQLLRQAWERDQISPNTSVDDGHWVRRVYVDLLGRIPTTAERAEFLADASVDRREALVDRLLSDPQHAVHMTQIFDTVFLGRSTRKQRDGSWQEFLERSFAANRPWNEVVRAIVLARPEREEDRGAAWYLFERGDKYQEIAESISPAIFGVQIQCAQCHDHPLAAEIKQQHYWGLVAFFNRGTPQMTPQGPQVAESAIGGFSNFANLEGVAQPNLLAYLGADIVDEERPEDPSAQQDADDLYHAASGIDGQTEGLPRVPNFSRRQAFADQVLAGHPWVARAMVNRLWYLALGRGLVHPVDKLDSTHSTAHPDLFAWLSRDFVESGYDVRRMLRAIVLSEAYGLALGKPTPGTSPDSFAYALEKPLTAEAMGRSLAVALTDQANAQAGARQRMLVEVFPEVFPEVAITTLTQTFFLSNHPEFNQWLSPEGENLPATMLQLESLEARVDLAFQRVLGRLPSGDERQRAVEFLTARRDREARGASDLVWALVTSAEFRFNH